jgi:hypothetical protein
LAESTLEKVGRSVVRELLKEARLPVPGLSLTERPLQHFKSHLPGNANGTEVVPRKQHALSVLRDDRAFLLSMEEWWTRITINQFYDVIAECYLYFYRDWQTQLERRRIKPKSHLSQQGDLRVLDASCGIRITKPSL